MRNNQTPTHRRIAHRLQKSRERQINCQRNKYTQVDRFLVIFERAWKEYYQMPANIQYAHGWYYLNGNRYQHTKMERILAVILAKLQEIDSPNPDKEETNDGREAA